MVIYSSVIVNVLKQWSRCTNLPEFFHRNLSTILILSNLGMERSGFKSWDLPIAKWNLMFV